MMRTPEGSARPGAPEEGDADRAPAPPCPSTILVDAAARTIGRQIVGLPLGPDEAELGTVAHLLIGLDQLATIRERHGQLVADRVVGETATRLRARLRRSDLVGRDERGRLFAVCPCASLHAARGLAERLRSVAAAARIPLAGGALAVTVTIDVRLEARRLRSAPAR